MQAQWSFQNEKMVRFKYAKEDDNKGFCCNGGEVNICSEQPTPRSEDIINIWTEGYLKGRVLRKYGRQISYALALESFKSNKEIVQEGYNPSFIIQGKPFVYFGTLYPPTGSQP